jgi:hypothetical protein
MEFITYLQERLSEQLPALIAEYDGEITASSLSELEVAVKHMTHELGNEITRQVLEAQEPRYPADNQLCPQCGETAQYQRRRQGMTITLQGRVYYRRSYYVCAHCGRGHYPLDERLGIQPGQMSQEVINVAALLGAQDAFGTSSDVLARTTLLELSPNSIRKACQRVGETVATLEQEQHARNQVLDHRLAQKRAPAPKRLYGSMDGFMTLFEDGWHEMKAGAWWTVDEHTHAHNIQYYVDTVEAEGFADLVWATGDMLNAAHAEELVFVTDAAEWIDRIIAAHFPHATHIIDWYHACAYLAPVAQAAFQEADQREAWLMQVRTWLWNGQLNDVIRACEQCCHSQLKPEDDPASIAARYFTNHRHQMDYPTYRAQGYHIGSGTMESGCKQIGLERLKISGARWSYNGARLVAKARAAYLSGRWDEVCAPAA